MIPPCRYTSSKRSDYTVIFLEEYHENHIPCRTTRHSTNQRQLPARHKAALLLRVFRKTVFKIKGRTAERAADKPKGYSAENLYLSCRYTSCRHNPDGLHLRLSDTACKPCGITGQPKRRLPRNEAAAVKFSGLPSIRGYSFSFQSGRSDNSVSCLRATDAGASVSGQVAFWVFGKAITSRIDEEPVIIISSRSSPKARPP